jgi:hypothetical protein
MFILMGVLCVGPFRTRAEIVFRNYRQHILEAKDQGEILRSQPFQAGSDEDLFSQRFLQAAVAVANGQSPGPLLCRYHICVTEDGAHHQHFVSDAQGRLLFRTTYIAIVSPTDRWTREFLERAVATLSAAAAGSTGKES